MYQFGDLKFKSCPNGPKFGMNKSPTPTTYYPTPTVKQKNTLSFHRPANNCLIFFPQSCQGCVTECGWRRCRSKVNCCQATTASAAGDAKEQHGGDWAGCCCCLAERANWRRPPSSSSSSARLWDRCPSSACWATFSKPRRVSFQALNFFKSKKLQSNFIMNMKLVPKIYSISHYLLH